MPARLSLWARELAYDCHSLAPGLASKAGPATLARRPNRWLPVRAPFGGSPCMGRGGPEWRHFGLLCSSPPATCGPAAHSNGRPCLPFTQCRLSGNCVTSIGPMGIVVEGQQQRLVHIGQASGRAPAARPRSKDDWPAQACCCCCCCCDIVATQSAACARRNRILVVVVLAS